MFWCGSGLKAMYLNETFLPERRDCLEKLVMLPRIIIPTEHCIAPFAHYLARPAASGDLIHAPKSAGIGILSYAANKYGLVESAHSRQEDCDRLMYIYILT
jgi:hypothetical protein